MSFTKSCFFIIYRIPRSFVVFFHEALKASQAAGGESLTEITFGPFLAETMAQWKRLSPEERRVSWLHTKASY